MTIREVDNPEAPQTPPAIDYSRMGQAVAESLKGMIPAPAPAAPVMPASQFQEALKALRANQDNDNGSIDTLAALFEANRADMSREQQQVIGNALISERIASAKRTLKSEIARAVEEDDDLEPYAQAVELLVVQEFDYSEEMRAEREKVLRGELDVKAVRKLVSKHFGSLTGTKKKAGGLAGMNGTTVGPQAAAAAQAQGSGKTFKELNEKQRELYYSIKAEHDRVGQKRHGMKPEEVEATALRRASARFND